MLKVPLIFGLVTGLLVFFYFLVLYWLGISPLGNKRVLDYGIYLIMICTACWYYRRYVGLGWLHLWEALTIGYVTVMTASFVTGWLIYFFLTYGDTAVLPAYINEMVAMIREDKANLAKTVGEAGWADLLKKIQATKASDLIADEISKRTLMSVIPILVISLIFRKQKRDNLEQIN